MGNARILVTIALLVAPLVAAGQGQPPRVSDPFGRPATPRAVDRTKLGPRLTASDLARAATQQACMVDSYGITYLMTLTPDTVSGPAQFTVSGTSNPGSGWNWTLSGWIHRVAVGSFQYFWRLDNPYADGCNGGWVDYATISATGPKLVPAGTFTSYCSGTAAYQDPAWKGTLYRGACP